MKRTLYELLNSTEAAELEGLLDENTTDLPAGISLKNIKRQTFQKAGLVKKRPIRLLPVASLAAYFCLVITFALGIAMWKNHSLRDSEETPSNTDDQLQANETLHPSIPNEDEDLSGDENAMTEPPLAITLRNLGELSEMRVMAHSEDRQATEDYLLSIPGSGAEDQDDLISFLDLIDSLPIPQLINGSITWIEQTVNDTNTNLNTEPVFLSMTAENGESVLLEYHLAVTDIPSAVTQLEENGAFLGSTLSSPLQTEDKRITIYGESRKTYDPGNRDVITWYAEIDGIFVWIKYFTEDLSKIDTAMMFHELSIVSICDLENALYGDVEFQAQAIPMDSSTDITDLPQVVVFHSAEELEDYFLEILDTCASVNKGSLGLADFISLSSSIISKYPSSYFESQSLIMVLLEGSRETIGQEVTGVTQETWNQWNITIESQRSEVTTDSAALWCILIEPKAGVSITNTADIHLNIVTDKVYDSE